MMDLDDLRAAIKGMTPRKSLFKVLKQELQGLGYWQNRPRGNPKAGFRAMKERKSVD